MERLFDELARALERTPGRPMAAAPDDWREASVLVPLFLRGGTPYVLFTKRPITLRTHAGQISFPGGGRDPEDETAVRTALRETHEELGIDPTAVNVLGTLDETPTITRFRVTPIVGVIPPDLRYRPNPVEIEEVLEVPLPHLLDPANQRLERRRFTDDEEHDVHFFDYGTHVIWGATARILRTLLQLGAELPSFHALRAK